MNWLDSSGRPKEVAPRPTHRSLEVGWGSYTPFACLPSSPAEQLSHRGRYVNARARTVFPIGSSPACSHLRGTNIFRGLVPATAASGFQSPASRWTRHHRPPWSECTPHDTINTLLPDHVSTLQRLAFVMVVVVVVVIFLNWRLVAVVVVVMNDGTKERRNEGTKERRNDGRNEGTTERRNEGTMEGTTEGTTERRNGGTEERRNGGTEERRNGGTEERRNDGTTERRNDQTTKRPNDQTNERNVVVVVVKSERYSEFYHYCTLKKASSTKLFKTTERVLLNNLCNTAVR